MRLDTVLYWVLWIRMTCSTVPKSRSGHILTFVVLPPIFVCRLIRGGAVYANVQLAALAADTASIDALSTELWCWMKPPEKELAYIVRLTLSH